jgi:hypothetical protein
MMAKRFQCSSSQLSNEETQLEEGKSWKWNDYQRYQRINMVKSRIIMLMRVALNHVKEFMTRKNK